MNIKVLMENVASREGICAAHGLSIYIETANHKILMDMGPDIGFVKNAENMGVDLSEVDIAVLSHGHFDHSGGLVEFMNINDHACIYAATGYDLPHYDKSGKYIGVEPFVAGNSRITALDGDLKIDDEVSILRFSASPFAEDINTCGMTEGVRDDFGKIIFTPERFLHEHYLMITEGSNKVLFSGCSHRGIINIASWAHTCGINYIVGGFHLKDVSPEDTKTLDHVAAELLKLPITYYTGHCTGKEQYNYLKNIMGSSLQYAASGDEFSL